jgi:hypothetical protein
MKRIAFTVIIMTLLNEVTAQDYVDNALLFSRTQPAGSARIQAIGGAQVALGGDYSSALSNPAGLGMFNRSELTFSLGFDNARTGSDYLGSSSSDSRGVLTVPGLSYVHKTQTDGKEKFLGGAFGVTYSRINGLNSRYSYEGDNSESSILDFFIKQAEGLTPNDLENDYYYSLTGLAFNGYRLIDLFADQHGNTLWDTELYPVDINGNYDYPTVRQSEQLLRKGSQSQISFSYGGNYDDVFFFGASLGLVNLSYKQEQVYTESDFRYPFTPGFNPLTSFQIVENFDIQGSGVNFAIGVIARPVEFLQLGASFVTPTISNISDSYTARLDSRWNNYSYPGDPVPLNNEFAEFDVPLISEYDLRTPSRASVGVAFISKYGFVSADAEFVNYAKAKYSSNQANSSYSSENNSITSLYTNVMNLRIGGEFRYDIWRARLGYNYMPDPFRETSGIADRDVQRLTGGLGVRKSNFFIDVAFITSQTKGERIPYSVPSLPTPVADLSITNTQLIFTVGFPF